MAVVWAWVGAPSETGATVAVEVGNGPTAALLVATDEAMTSPVTFDPVTVDGDNVAKLTATGLVPNTQYYYRIQDNGVTDTGLTGAFRTLPPTGSPASFEVVVASCAGAGGDYPGVLGDELAPDRVSNALVFDTIRERNPLMWVMPGDRGYYDLVSGSHGISGGASVANYQDAIRDNARQPRQLALFSQIPSHWVADDHDFLGNDLNGADDATGRANFLTVYGQMVPHYPLGGTDTATDQYWQIGRVAFVLSDQRTDSDSNSDTDDSGKSMMGAAQKARLATFLATTTAEALVWIMPRQWMGVATDSWATFTTERDELVDLFDQHGWLGRMVAVYGDRHALGLDTGGNNVWGGFPVLQAASLDTSFPSSPVSTRFDTGPDHPGRGQYGVVSVVDTDDAIDITLAGYIGTSLWAAHTLTVTVDSGEEPEPEPGPNPLPPVATAVIRTRVTWYGCDAVTGNVIAELQDIRGQISRVLGAYTSSALEVPIPLAGPGHVPLGLTLQATQPGRTMIAAVVNDIPAWAGLVLTREGGTDAMLRLGCVSIEGYLTRHEVASHEYVQVDEATIAAELAGDAGDIPGVGSGIGLVVDATPTGTLRDRTYEASDRASVYDRLQELMAIQGGPEWTIDLDWTSAARNAVAKIFRVRNQIGVAASPPPAVFRTTAQSVFAATSGSEARYTYREDYSSGRGANYVVAYSSGEGDDQPTSTPAIGTAELDGGWPIYKRSWQPASNITSQSVLDAHAQAELDRLRGGIRTWQIDVRWDAYPRYGVDWELGDDVGWDLRGHRHPDGVAGQGRAIGWTLDIQAGTMRLILAEED